MRWTAAERSTRDRVLWFIQFRVLVTALLISNFGTNGYKVSKESSPFSNTGQGLFSFDALPKASSSKGMEDLVVPEGYPLEEHYVTTDDGYILGLFRIPNGRGSLSCSFDGESGYESREQCEKKPVVLLQHGLLTSSAVWVFNGPSKSLAFILADKNFDVWMGNSRGNTFSRKHKTLSPSSVEFWNFTYDGMASYDLPSTIYYILNKTRVDKISYIGHSQGTTTAFAAFSRDSHLASRVSISVMLAPITFVTHMQSTFLRELARLDLDQVFHMFGVKEFLPSRDLSSDLFRHFCEDTPSMCNSVITAFCGYNPQNIDKERWSVYMSYVPAGTSTLDIMHWVQAVKLMNETRFQEFDFGNHCTKYLILKCPCNKAIYGEDSPPIYNVGNIHMPVALFTGGKDKLSDSKDVALLVKALPDGSVIFRHEEAEYEHLDFTWGKDAHQKIYPQIVEILERFSGLSFMAA